jgi:hypothetical protein
MGRHTVTRSRGPQPVPPQSTTQPSNHSTQVSNATDPTPSNPTFATSTVAASTAPKPTATLTVQTQTGEIIAQWPVSRSKYVHRLNGNYPDGISHLEIQPGGQPTRLHHCPSDISYQIFTSNIPPDWEAYTTFIGDGWVIGIRPEEGTYPPPL